MLRYELTYRYWCRKRGKLSFVEGRNFGGKGMGLYYVVTLLCPAGADLEAPIVVKACAKSMENAQHR